MKHRVGFNRLGRKPSHRKALHRNMVTSLFRHERIRTTKAKAQAIRRTAEKMITRAKVDSVHNRRMIGRDIKDKAILAKLFVEIGPRFKERPGGYTRMLKIGPRPGDAAAMVLLELVGDAVEKTDAKAKRDEASKKPTERKAEVEKSAKSKSTSKRPAKPRIEDSPAEDTAPEDTAPEDTAPEDTAAEDTAAEDAAAVPAAEEPVNDASESEDSPADEEK